MAFRKPQSLPSLLLGLLASLAATAALAQYPQGGSTDSGTSPGGTTDSTPGTGSGSSGSSGVGSGMGPGMMGSGPAAMQRWGDGITPGWSLMTPAERMEHQLRMRSMTSYDECKTYMAQHQAQMDARANQQGGGAVTVQPRVDVCEGMPR